MNDARREEIRRVVTLVKEAKDILESVLDQERTTSKICPNKSKTMKKDKEWRKWLTHWSRLRRVVITQFPPARRCYGTSADIADEILEERRRSALRAISLRFIGNQMPHMKLYETARKRDRRPSRLRVSATRDLTLLACDQLRDLGPKAQKFRPSLIEVLKALPQSSHNQS
jgi:hypothetical protein